MKLIILLIAFIIVYLAGIIAHGLDIRQTIKRKGYAKLSFLDFTVIKKQEDEN